MCIAMMRWPFPGSLLQAMVVLILAQAAHAHCSVLPPTLRLLPLHISHPGNIQGAVDGPFSLLMCLAMMRWPFPGSLLQAMVVLILAQAAHAHCSVLPPTLRLLPLHISHPGNIQGAVDGPFSLLMCITMMRWPFPGSLLQAMVVLILAQAAHAHCSVLPPTLRLLPLHISHPGNIPGAVDGPFSLLMCITVMRWPFPGSLLQAMVVLILAQAAHARCSVLPPTLRLLPLHISHPGNIQGAVDGPFSLLMCITMMRWPFPGSLLQAMVVLILAQAAHARCSVLPPTLRLLPLHISHPGNIPGAVDGPFSVLMCITMMRWPFPGSLLQAMVVLILAQAAHARCSVLPPTLRLLPLHISHPGNIQGAVDGPFSLLMCITMMRWPFPGSLLQAMVVLILAQAAHARCSVLPPTLRLLPLHISHPGNIPGAVDGPFSVLMCITMMRWPFPGSLLQAMVVLILAQAAHARCSVLPPTLRLLPLHISHPGNIPGAVDGPFSLLMCITVMRWPFPGSLLQAMVVLILAQAAHARCSVLPPTLRLLPLHISHPGNIPGAVDGPFSLLMCITVMRWPFPGSLLQAMVVLILAQAAHARCSVLPPLLHLLPLHISHPGNIPGAVDGPFSLLMCITVMRWPFPGSLLQAMVVHTLAQAAHARCSVLPPTLRLLPLHISHPGNIPGAVDGPFSLLMCITVMRWPFPGSLLQAMVVLILAQAAHARCSVLPPTLRLLPLHISQPVFFGALHCGVPDSLSHLGTLHPHKT
ncbi:uncharacterized protein LOC144115266 isoform X3 [Amblyomma americanum]